MGTVLSSPQDAVTGRFSFVHGMGSSPEYAAWANAIYRCENKDAHGWPDYGGRGITVCDRWRKCFQAFLEDMGPRRSHDQSLDRIDVNGNYEPGNCRWASAKTQARNRRNTPKVCGLSPMDLAEASGLPYNTVKNRLRRGWSHEAIIKTPRRNYPRSISC
jgi:hypothetical protein